MRSRGPERSRGGVLGRNIVAVAKGQIRSKVVGAVLLRAGRACVSADGEERSKADHRVAGGSCTACRGAECVVDSMRVLRPLDTLRHANATPAERLTNAHRKALRALQSK